MQNRAHDIVRLLGFAKAHASLLAEDNPEKAIAVEKLKQGVERIRKEFISAVIYENSESKS